MEHHDFTSKFIKLNSESPTTRELATLLYTAPLIAGHAKITAVSGSAVVAGQGRHFGATILLPSRSGPELAQVVVKMFVH